MKREKAKEGRDRTGHVSGGHERDGEDAREKRNTKKGKEEGMAYFTPETSSSLEFDKCC